MSFKEGLCGFLALVLAGGFLTGCDTSEKPAAGKKPESAEKSKPGTAPAADKTRDVKLSADGRTLLKYRGSAEEFAVPAGVTAIGDGAFAESRDLTSVTLPEGVVSISERAFANCQNLRSVTLPTTLESIGKEAFWWCSNLVAVTLPPNVKSIGDGAFAKCGLMNLTLPDGLVSIGAKAFAGCAALAGVNVPASLNHIGEGAFNECPCERWVKERFPDYKR